MLMHLNFFSCGKIEFKKEKSLVQGPRRRIWVVSNLPGRERGWMLRPSDPRGVPRTGREEAGGEPSHPSWHCSPTPHRPLRAGILRRQRLRRGMPHHVSLEQGGTQAPTRVRPHQPQPSQSSLPLVHTTSSATAADEGHGRRPALGPTGGGGWPAASMVSTGLWHVSLSKQGGPGLGRTVTPISDTALWREDPSRNPTDTASGTSLSSSMPFLRASL